MLSGTRRCLLSRWIVRQLCLCRLLPSGNSIRSSLALLVAQRSECGYCVSAHTAVGKMVGLSADEISASREGRASDDRDAAALRLADSILETKGGVSDDDLSAARDAGLSDGEILEIATNVIANLFTNYVNRLANTDIDFPVVDLQETAVV